MSQIHRIKKENNFVILDKLALNDEKLSWQAKGLHSYIMSLPDDWKLNLADLKSRSTNGRDSTANILNELINAKYVTRVKILDSRNRFSGYDYNVYEFPFYEFPEYGKPEYGEAEYEEPVANK